MGMYATVTEVKPARDLEAGEERVDIGDVEVGDVVETVFAAGYGIHEWFTVARIAEPEFMVRAGRHLYDSDDVMRFGGRCDVVRRTA